MAEDNYKFTPAIFAQPQDNKLMDTFFRCTIMQQNTDQLELREDHCF